MNKYRVSTEEGFEKTVDMPIVPTNKPKTVLECLKAIVEIHDVLEWIDPETDWCRYMLKDVKESITLIEGE